LARKMEADEYAWTSERPMKSPKRISILYLDKQKYLLALKKLDGLFC